MFCWLFPYQTSNMQTWILKPCQAQPSSPLDPHRFWVDRNAPSASDQGALKIENLHLVNLYSSNQVTWKLLLAVYKVYIYIHRIIEDIFLSRFSCLSHFDKHDSNHLPLQMELHMLIIPRSQWKTYRNMAPTCTTPFFTKALEQDQAMTCQNAVFLCVSSFYAFLLIAARLLFHASFDNLHPILAALPEGRRSYLLNKTGWTLASHACSLPVNYSSLTLKHFKTTTWDADSFASRIRQARIWVGMRVRM